MPPQEIHRTNQRPRNIQHIYQFVEILGCFLNSVKILLIHWFHNNVKDTCKYLLHSHFHIFLTDPFSSFAAILLLIAVAIIGSQMDTKHRSLVFYVTADVLLITEHPISLLVNQLFNFLAQNSYIRSIMWVSMYCT